METMLMILIFFAGLAIGMIAQGMLFVPPDVIVQPANVILQEAPITVKVPETDVSVYVYPQFEVVCQQTETALILRPNHLPVAVKGA